MKIMTSEMREVFRAYARELKTKPQEQEKSESLHLRKGFEQVELSKEALDLSNGMQQQSTEETAEN